MEKSSSKEREDAWKTQIDASLKQLNILATEWTDLENIQRLQKVGTDIDMFRMYQEEIEDIAQTEENTPARKIFFNQVDPLQKVIVSNLTRMLKLELKNPHTVERRGLASLMSDIEATTTLAIEKLKSTFCLARINFRKNSNTIGIITTGIICTWKPRLRFFQTSNGLHSNG